MGFICGLLLCGVFAGSAVDGQSPQTQTDPDAVLTAQRKQAAQLAATWLHSGDPRLQAWGAYFVLRDQNKQLIPDLLSLANAYEVTGLPVLSTRREQHDAMLAILDALIQLDPGIPAEEGARLYPEFRTQSLILLSRAGVSPDDLSSSNSFLLEIFRTEHSQRAWLAAGNMLAERRADGFAAVVLGSLTEHLNLRVISTLRSVGGTGEVACGDGFLNWPDDRLAWPEIGTYSLAEPGHGTTLLADGADPAYYIRRVGKLYERDIYGGGQCQSVIVDSWDLVRQHYVTRMLGEPLGDPPLRASIHETIVWENGDAYLAYMRNLVEQEQTAFIEVTRRLKDAGLMTAEEAAGAKPRLEITVVDDRDDTKTPLPNAGKLEENVTVKM